MIEEDINENDVSNNQYYLNIENINEEQFHYLIISCVLLLVL